MKRHNDEHIGSALAGFLRTDKKLSNKYLQAKIRTYWKAEMGVMINKYTQNLSLRKNVLYIELNSAALKNELLMQKESIITMLNEHLKKDIIKQVVVK